MQVDILGLENVVKYIQASKLTKFTILRAGNSGANISVFESVDSDDNETVVKRFTEWAEVVNNNIPYKIILFDFAELKTDEAGATKVVKSKNKSGKMECLFILNNTAVNFQSNNSQQPQQQTMGETLNIASLRADIIKEISKQQEDNLILNEIKALKLKFQELEEDDDDDDEPEQGGLLGGVDATQLQQIMGLVQMFKSSTTPPAINGIEEDKEIQKQNINNAIKRLYKHDKNLDTDLLKLAEIAESKPDMFKMLLSTLRGM